MGYQGADLKHFFSKPTTAAPTRRAMRNMADDVTDAWARRAAEFTPVKSGRLAESWRSTRPERIVGGVQATVENSHYTAKWVEFGTQPHDLKPGEGEDDPAALSTPEGPRAGAHHPGAKPAAPLARSAAEIEGELGRIAQPSLTTWAAEVEAAAKRHKGYA